MATDRPKPFRFPRQSGILQIWMLRMYATWLFPQINRPWESPGVKRVFHPDRVQPENPPEPLKPYRFRKSDGPCLMADLKHFGAYVLPLLPQLIRPVIYTEVDLDISDQPVRNEGPLYPDPDKKQYQWPSKQAIAEVKHLRHLNDHISKLLDQREQPKETGDLVTISATDP